MVGGSVTKPLPRKDIDIILYREVHESDESVNVMERTQRSFDELKGFIDSFIDNTQNQYQRVRSLPPAYDEEFDNPNILKFDGSVIVARQDKGDNSIESPLGTQIEFINILGKSSFDEFLAKDNKPFTLLVA